MSKLLVIPAGSDPGDYADYAAQHGADAIAVGVPEALSGEGTVGPLPALVPLPDPTPTPTPPAQPIPPTREEFAALSFVARTTIAERVRAETFPLADAPRVAALFPEWAPGLDVTAGRIYTFNGELVECVQSHTTQADWAPDVAPALWKIHRDPGVAAEWVQPTGSTDAYPKDALTLHNGKTWKSNVAANVWEPPTQWTEVV